MLRERAQDVTAHNEERPLDLADSLPRQHTLQPFQLRVDVARASIRHLLNRARVVPRRSSLVGVLRVAGRGDGFVEARLEILDRQVFGRLEHSVELGEESRSFPKASIRGSGRSRLRQNFRADDGGMIELRILNLSSLLSSLELRVNITTSKLFEPNC